MFDEASLRQTNCYVSKSLVSYLALSWPVSARSGEVTLRVCALKSSISYETAANDGLKMIVISGKRFLDLLAVYWLRLNILVVVICLIWSLLKISNSAI